MYYNTDDVTSKYYYAYIVDMEYKNDEVTDVKIETDVFQTWQFDFTYLKSFIERKHVTDDVIGKHTILEPVATGEYICNDYDVYSDMSSLANDYYIMVNVSQYIDGTDAVQTDIGGIPFARWFLYLYYEWWVSKFNIKLCYT